MNASEHLARASGCRRLWAAVLMIAINDARRASGKLRRDARRFLLSDQAVVIASRAGVRDARERIARILNAAGHHTADDEVNGQGRVPSGAIRRASGLDRPRLLD